MRKALKIGILECWSNRPEWMEHGDFADWFPPFLQQADQNLTFKIYRAHLGELPKRVTDCDAWLLTGSAASVYEQLPWQADLIAFLRSAAGIQPMIGICYGHQLLHYALGGSVENSTAWGIGVHCYEVLHHPEWSAHTADQVRLIASHQDQVTQTAPGTRRIAHSAFCPHAITQIGETILTFQAHPEMTKALAKKVFSARRVQQGQAETDQALQSLSSELDDVTMAQWIVDFLAHARSQPKALVA